MLQCKNYRFFKTCDNPLTLIEQELEQRLIDYIVNRLLVPENLNFAVERFHTELNARIAIEELQCKESQAGKKKLIREQSRLELELKNIINSLREIGPEESLKSEFQRIQGRLNLLKNELQENIISKLSPYLPKTPINLLTAVRNGFLSYFSQIASRRNGSFDNLSGLLRFHVTRKAICRCAAFKEDCAYAIT